MLDDLKKFYPHITAKNCLSSLIEPLVKITDQEDGCCRFANLEDINVIHIINKDETLLHFLFVDKCLFGRATPFKKCDCAVFDENRFCFIEFKQTTNNKEDYISSASEQLLSTIKELKDKLSFEKYSVECYVAFNDDPPIPAAITENQVYEKKFWDLYRSLFFIGNQITFPRSA